MLPALEDMLSQGLVGDGRPFTVAIKALGDNGQTSRALRLLEVRAEPAYFHFLVLVVDLNFVAEFCCWVFVYWYWFLVVFDVCSLIVLHDFVFDFYLDFHVGFVLDFVAFFFFLVLFLVLVM